MMTIKIIISALTLITLSQLCACGGGGGSSSSGSNDDSSGDGGSGGGNSAPASTGYFIDAAVSGLSYQTTTSSGSTVQGVTGENGEYDFYPDRTIRFYLGELTLGSDLGSALTTPFSFVDETTHEDFPQNMAQLLLSLDSDQDPSDGIQVESAVNSGFAGITAGLQDMLLQSSEEFESDFQGFVDSALPSYSDRVVTANEAQSHLQESLADIDYDVTLPGSTWQTDFYPQYFQYWDVDSEGWVIQQSCGSSDYDLYKVDVYTASGVTTTEWNEFDFLPNCARVGAESVQALRDYDELTMCGYKSVTDPEADLTICTFADLNQKVSYTNEENVLITLHSSHVQDSGTVYQTFYREYEQDDVTIREKWRAIITETSTAE